MELHNCIMESYNLGGGGGGVVLFTASYIKENKNKFILQK